MSTLNLAGDRGSERPDGLLETLPRRGRLVIVGRIVLAADPEIGAWLWVPVQCPWHCQCSGKDDNKQYQDA